VELAILAYNYGKQASLVNLWNEEISSIDSKAATTKFVQINMHCSKATRAVLCQKLALGRVDTPCDRNPEFMRPYRTIKLHWGNILCCTQ
jgi:hypothetical protein